MQLLNTKFKQLKGFSRTETFISLDQQIDRQIQL
jgi:Lrp/AsnC family transcriptional regulator for asnA, asnC and gidA